MRVGAAPVPPRKPSMAMMSAPLRAMPDGNGCNVVHRRNLDDDRLFVAVRLPLRRKQADADPQWSKYRGAARAKWRPSPPGIIRVLEMSPTIFAPGRWPPMPGFAPCPILISMAAPALEVILMHAKAAGRDLHNGVCAVLVEILMQTALAGVVVDAERFCAARARLSCAL